MDSSPTLSTSPCGVSTLTATDQARHVRERLVSARLHSGTTWRIAPTPFLLSEADLAAITVLGRHLLSFTQALNELYYRSVEGAEPRWVADYLDQGKPPELIAFARMDQFRDLVPGVIRPDLILTDDGFMISELDSVPGGIGLTGCMAEAYTELGASVVGGGDGMVQGFFEMVRAVSARDEPTLAIAVSEEARDYRSEMEWLAGRLRHTGLRAEAVAPEDITAAEDELRFLSSAKISVLYRFFELFDLKNIPNIDMFLKAAASARVALTPPIKPWLEEKLAFALVHHPSLETYWAGALSTEAFTALRRIMPKTWVLAPRPASPSAVVPPLTVSGRAVSDWADVGQAGQKQRRFIIKPSGFSELAWGARGVSVGHDMAQKDWAATLQAALDSFETVPHILQEFRKGRRVRWQYYDPHRDDIVPMEGRVRLSPYYFVAGDVPKLGGILATACPLNKKLIHGMTEAIMAPCASGHP